MASICRTIRRAIGLQPRGHGYKGGNDAPSPDKKETQKLNRKAKRQLRKKAIIEKRTKTRGDK